MPSIFQRNAAGFWAYADPDSDIDYGVTCWAEDETFASATWEIDPGGSPGPALHDDTINAAPVTIEGETYAIGKVASVWVSGMTAGQTYTITLHAVFSGGGRDDRSFQLICRER